MPRPSAASLLPNARHRSIAGAWIAAFACACGGTNVAPVTNVPPPPDAGVVDVPSAPDAGVGSVSPCYAFEMPPKDTLRASPKKVFAFYYPPFPVSIENADPSSDFWQSWLTPDARNGEYQSIGGLMRDRPFPRAPLSDPAWRQRDFEKEIRQAIAAGLDGFIYEFPDHVSTNPAQNQLSTMLAAAAAVDPGFRVVLSPDFPTDASATTDGLFTTISAVANHPSLMKVDGKIVLASFAPEREPVSFWATLRDRCAAAGIPITYWPFLSYTADTTAYADWNDLVSGYSTWGTATASSASVMAQWSAAAHARGRAWMAPVTFEDVRHKLTSSLVSSRVYRESHGSLTFRTHFETAISANADWVALLTWNDYTETWMAPSQERGYFLADLAAYHTTWFKTGQAPPVVRDALYYDHRRQRTDAPFDATLQTAPPMTLIAGGPASEVVELVAFLTAPGTLVITQGSDVKTLDVPNAGMTVFQVPMVTDTTPVFALQRAGKTVVQLQSHTPIVSQVVYQDLMHHAGGGLACTRPE